jgi:hypothetical protein
MRDPVVARDGEVKRRRRRRSRMLSRQAAGALLGTSPETLTLWEERFGYPTPAGFVGGEPLYDEEMLIALRDALGEELSIASAIDEARRRTWRPEPH